MITFCFVFHVENFNISLSHMEFLIFDFLTYNKPSSFRQFNLIVQGYGVLNYP